jgi:hypothetical protein
VNNDLSVQGCVEKAPDLSFLNKETETSQSHLRALFLSVAMVGCPNSELLGAHRSNFLEVTSCNPVVHRRFGGLGQASNQQEGSGKPRKWAESVTPATCILEVLCSTLHPKTRLFRLSEALVDWCTLPPLRYVTSLKMAVFIILNSYLQCLTPKFPACGLTRALAHHIVATAFWP